MITGDGGWGIGYTAALGPYREKLSMSPRKGILVLALGALGLGAGLWLGSRDAAPLAPPQIQGIAYPEPQALLPFSLTDQDGQAFGPERFKDRWTLVYFGYTYCPDVCPTTLADLNGVLARLAERGEAGDVGVLLVSIDPARDTPERLRDYVRFFNPAFQAATGPQPELDKLFRQFGVIALRAGGGGESYTMDHSSTLILIDPDAKLHAIFTGAHDAEALLPDLLKLKARYGQR